MQFYHFPIANFENMWYSNAKNKKVSDFMLKEEKALYDFLDTLQLPNFDALPDIDLYKDQVLSYLARVPISHRSDDEITPAMINNYIKAGLLPRSNGKKYSKEHLAYLTIISKLKQVLSVNDAKTLLDMDTSEEEISSRYDKFKDVYELMLQVMRDDVAKSPGQNLADTAIQFAVISYISKIACEFLIDSISPETANKKADK